MIIGYTVPEIRCVSDVIIFHFGLFFALIPSNSLKNENINNNKKKKTGNIIILHKCTKNHDHMQYCYWDMVHDGCNYFSFWAIFCPFTPLTAQEIKISKKQNKNYWRYHFTYLYQKLWLDDVRFLRYGAWRTDGRKRWHIVVGAPPKKNQYFEQSATLFGMKKKQEL